MGNPTKQQQLYIHRMPFDMGKLTEFCGTKKLAIELAIDLGDALIESDRARSRNESDDMAFELFFWNGILFIGMDDLFDMGVVADSVIDYAFHEAYDDGLDATFSLCHYGTRRFIVVRYEFKEDDNSLAGWWLTREDQQHDRH